MGDRSTPAYTICGATAPNRGARTQSSKCTRRHFLAIAVAAVAIPASLTRAAENRAADNDKAEEKKDTYANDETLEQMEACTLDTVPLITFTSALENGKVKRVWFYGNTNQTCFYQLNDSKVYRIGEGFPIEAPRGTESPLHIMARVRNFALMATVPANPSRRNFGRQLRRNEAERVMSNTKSFNNQILIHQMEKQIVTINAKLKADGTGRRESIKNPEIEEFYVFDEASEAQQQKKRCPTYDFNKDVTAEATYSPLTDATYAKQYIANPEPKLDTNQKEQDFLKHVYQELDDMTQQRDALEQKLTSALSNIADLETSVTELKHETDSANKELVQERTRLEIAKRAKLVSPPRTNILATARNIASDVAEARANTFRLEAEKRASKAEKEASRLAKQRDAAQAALAAEKHRVTKLEQARRKHVGKPVEMGKLNNVENLIQQMDVQRHKLDHADYSPLWREDVLKNIDLCLSVLYSCENDIVDKRNTFVERSCAVVSSTKDLIARRTFVPAVSR